MELWRSKIWGPYLALFAMMLQLVFSYGHIHHSKLHIEGKILATAKSFFAQEPPGHSARFASHHRHNLVHSGHCSHHGHLHKHAINHSSTNQQEEEEGENCPTCWTLSASGTLILPAITGFNWRLKRFFKTRTAPNRQFVSSLSLRPYQVRAPPVTRVI